MSVDPKTLKRYKSVLAAFMSFLHGRQPGNLYERDHVFTEAELTAVIPSDVCRYMRLKAYGAEFPSPDKNPIHSRHSAISFDKKAISFWMPNREKWSVTRTEGNPTQSKDVIDLLKAVKKKEVRKQGAKSQVRRPMVGKEFESMHKLLLEAGNDDRRTTTSHASSWKRYGISAIVNFQFHMIARIDDSTQVVLEHVRVHDKFLHSLKVRLNWSKNVNDERDAPFQLVLGSMNHVYCVLWSLGLWLELNLKLYPPAMESPYLFCFCDDFRIPEGGQKAKSMIQSFMTKMFKRRELHEEEENAKQLLLGSHSIRKFACTYARSCGIHKDEKDIRGRWKGKGRVSDVYDDTELPYPDAKVGAVLCGGGPCIYQTNPAIDSAMMDSFVLSHVVPNVRKRLPDSACLVLGKALMWMITSPFADDHIPVDVKEEVLSDWAHVCGGDSDLDVEQSAMYKNPIQKLAVVVSGDFGAVFIDTIGELEQGDEGVAGGNRALGMQGSHANFRNQLTGMQSCLLALRQENTEMKSVITGLKISMEQNFGIVNGNVRRFAMRPTRNLTVLATAATNQQNQGGVAAQHAGGDRAMMLATLMPTPRSLHDLWQEYEFGVGGRKAAKLFSYSERGRSKHKFHRRKIVWDLISGLVRQGHTADSGIDRIYAVYGGQTSVSNIINGLKRDKKMVR